MNKTKRSAVALAVIPLLVLGVATHTAQAQTVPVPSVEVIECSGALIGPELDIPKTHVIGSMTMACKFIAGPQQGLPVAMPGIKLNLYLVRNGNLAVASDENAAQAVITDRHVVSVSTLCEFGVYQLVGDIVLDFPAGFFPPTIVSSVQTEPVPIDCGVREEEPPEVINVQAYWDAVEYYQDLIDQTRVLMDQEQTIFMIEAQEFYEASQAALETGDWAAYEVAKAEYEAARVIYRAKRTEYIAAIRTYMDAIAALECC